jgi:hypothetical protein
MRFWQVAALVLFFAFLAGGPRGVWAQETVRQAPPDAAEGEPTGGEQTAAVRFSLIPLVEAALNGELRWRPDWPSDFPPDGFSPAGGQAGPLSIELSDGGEQFNFRRDNAGRLVEFPYFWDGAWLRVTVSYYASGEIMEMNIGVGADAEPWQIAFPAGAVSFGAAAPAVTAAGGGAAFFVFFVLGGASLSETWYDASGSMLAYYRAGLRPEDDRWRVSSLQSWGEEGVSAVEYFFDSGGNITEIRSLGGAYSALYQDSRPVYWKRQPGASGETAQPPAGFALQWDEQGLLVHCRLLDANDGAETTAVEYRYESRRDGAGNWVNRQDIPLISRFGLLVPQSGRAWTRRINAGGD